MSSSIAIKVKMVKQDSFECESVLVKFRRPIAIDLYGLIFNGPQHMESLAVLIARLSSLTKQEVDQLDASEFFKLHMELDKFLYPKQTKEQKQ